MFGENRSKSVEDRRRQERLRIALDRERDNLVQQRYLQNRMKAEGKAAPAKYQSKNIYEGRDIVCLDYQRASGSSILSLWLYKTKSTASRVYARISAGTLNSQIPTLNGKEIHLSDAALDWSKTASAFWVYLVYYKNGNTPIVESASTIPENTEQIGYLKLAYVDGASIQNFLNGSSNCQLCNKKLYLWT